MDYRAKFHKYVYWLGDDIPEHMKQEARTFLLDCKEEYVPYIICTSNGFTWNNAIKILKEIGYPKNRLAAENIMYLFQDINWQCAETALDVIRNIHDNEPELIVNAIEDTAKKAYKYQDYDWLYGLSYVKENLGIKRDDFSDRETVKLLLLGEYYDNEELQ